MNNLINISEQFFSMATQINVDGIEWRAKLRLEQWSSLATSVKYKGKYIQGGTTKGRGKCKMLGESEQMESLTCN